MTVDIKGIDKGKLLAAIFNRSRVIGSGFLQAHRGPDVMTDEDGQKYVAMILAGEFGDDSSMMFPRAKQEKANRLEFDYLFGRPLKIDITDDEVYERGFDMDNGGPGTFQRIVDGLRS